MASELADEPVIRHVSPALATAIFAIPILFYWLLLRRGYSPSTRRAALLYLVASVLPGLIVVLFSPLP